MIEVHMSLCEQKEVFLFHSFVCSGTVKKHTHIHTLTVLLFPCRAVTQRPGGNAATGAQGLRKDTGRFDWKQILAYGKPALTLGPYSSLHWMPV